MTDAEEFIYSTYHEIKELGISNTSRVSLVRSSLDQNLYIRRIIPGDREAVYRVLKDSGIESIPQIREIIYDGNTTVFEEYITGTLLSQFAVNEKNFADIMCQLLHVLKDIHSLHIVHRDIKEDNFILADSGKLILTDFAIARLENDRLQSETDIVGTVGYAAPEQFRAAPADIRSDLYSFGILCRNILNQCVRMEKAEHTRWLSLIEKATSFEAEDRFQTAEEMLNAIRHPEFIDGKNQKHFLDFPHMTPPACIQLQKGESKTFTNTPRGTITLSQSNGTVELEIERDTKNRFRIFHDLSDAFSSMDYVLELCFLTSSMIITRTFYDRAQGPSRDSMMIPRFHELRPVLLDEEGDFVLGELYQNLTGFSILGDEESILDRESLNTYALCLS